MLEIGCCVQLQISFEINPPRIVQGQFFDSNLLNQALQKFIKRTLSVVDWVDGIHFTDSVLGIPRISSVSAACYLKMKCNKSNVTCSVRTRDRNFISISQLVSDAILIGVKALLVLMGDEPQQGSGSGITPSTALKMLYCEQFNRSIEFQLTIPNRIQNMSSIQKKIDAKPSAFVTQSIQSIYELGKVVDMLKPYHIPVVACIMIPSKQNQLCAQMIGLDWRAYQNNPVDFVREAGSIAAGVLLTSPNSLGSALELLQTMKNKSDLHGLYSTTEN